MVDQLPGTGGGRKQRRSYGPIYAAIGAAGLVIGVIAGVAVSARGGGAHQPQSWLMWWACGMGLCLGLVFSADWWRRLDEARREAHKWAWYWGATAGGGLATCALLVEFGSSQGRNDDFFSGGVFVLVLQAIGYGAAWVYWWARRR
jgi:hypothetical protein